MPPSKPKPSDRNSAAQTGTERTQLADATQPTTAGVARMRQPAKGTATGLGALATIGERLMELRTKRNLSQAVVASSVGVNRATYGQWENGTTIPEISKVEALSDFLKAPPEYIAFGIISNPDGLVTCVVPFIELNGNGSQHKLGNWGIPRSKLDQVGIDAENAFVVRIEKQKAGVNLSELCLVNSSITKISDSGDYVIINDGRVEIITIKKIFEKYYAVGENWSVEIESREYKTFGKIEGYLWSAA